MKVNSQNDIRLSKAADASPGGVTGKMNRLRELVTQSGSDVVTHREKTAIQKEVAKLTSVFDDDGPLSIVTSKRAQLNAINKRNQLGGNAADTAGSTVRDANAAMEMARNTSAKIVSEPSYAIFAQANILPQSVLNLLD